MRVKITDSDRHARAGKEITKGEKNTKRRSTREGARDGIDRGSRAVYCDQLPDPKADTLAGALFSSGFP